MRRGRARDGLDGILNLDSLVDVVTNTNGMLILLAVFTTLLAIGKAYTLTFPVARVSEKEAVFFECRNHRVVVVSANGGYGEDYFVVPVGAERMVVPRDATHGETPDELRRPGSAFLHQVQAMDPANEYAAFLVRPDGFEVFRAAREALAELRPDLGVGWEPMPEDRPIIFGARGRSVREF